MTATNLSVDLLSAPPRILVPITAEEADHLDSSLTTVVTHEERDCAIARVLAEATARLNRADATPASADPCDLCFTVDLEANEIRCDDGASAESLPDDVCDRLEDLVAEMLELTAVSF